MVIRRIKATDNINPENMRRKSTIMHQNLKLYLAEVTRNLNIAVRCVYLSLNLGSESAAHRYNVEIDEKSRRLTDSQRSAGVQANFLETHSSADTNSSDLRAKGIQADFSEDLSVGVQADMDLETMGSLKEFYKEAQSSG